MNTDDQIGFRLTPENAEEFFKRCIDRNAETLEAKMAIMEELIKELRALYLNPQDLRRIVRNKRILVIKPESEE
jgi:hypothetical protein